MTTTQTTKVAETPWDAMAAKLKANVDDWYADRIDHATFSDRQTAIWAEIDRLGWTVHAGVLAVLRDSL